MTASALSAKVRPAKVRSALLRRWFERRVPRVTAYRPGLETEELGTPYGGWIMPRGVIEPGWTCYCVGVGADISFDLALVREHGVTVRAIEPVEQFVDQARREAAQEPRFSAHHAAIAAADGPLRMQRSHDPQSHSVSAAQLYDTAEFIEFPGRTLSSLMAELGDEKIDLLKLDIEGLEYELVPQFDLRALGVKVFATQLHHTGSVGDAKRLIAGLKDQGYAPVGCRPAVKITFVREDMFAR